MIEGRLAENVVLAEYADAFVGIRKPVRSLVAQRRIAFGRYTTRAFEHIAMRADRGGGTTSRPDTDEWTRARA